MQQQGLMSAEGKKPIEEGVREGDDPERNSSTFSEMEARSRKEENSGRSDFRRVLIACRFRPHHK
jgi:hypothetical protein